MLKNLPFCLVWLRGEFATIGVRAVHSLFAENRDIIPISVRALACSAVCTPTGHSSVPGDGDLSILLIEGAAYQDVYLSCSATLDSDCDYAGLVFGYVDASNFWVRLFDNANDEARVWPATGGFHAHALVAAVLRCR